MHQVERYLFGPPHTLLEPTDRKKRPCYSISGVVHHTFQGMGAQPPQTWDFLLVFWNHPELELEETTEEISHKPCS